MENKFKNIFLGVFYVFCIGVTIAIGVSYFKDENKETQNIETISKIKYDKRKYSCEAGETLKIKTTATDGFDYINFYSSNIENANVYESDEECDGCKYIIVDCIKAGRINIGSKYNNTLGETASLSISAGFLKDDDENTSTGSTGSGSSNTEKNNSGSTGSGSSNTEKNNSGSTGSGNSNTGKNNSGGSSSSSKSSESIIFNESSYSCVAGKKLYATITALSSGSKSTVKSYSIDDTSIATLSENTSKVSDCKNCKYIVINCLKAGKANISAVSSSNAKVTASVNVSKLDVGKINFNKSEYSCKAGDTIDAIITVSPTEENSIKSYTSSNDNIAKISKSTNGSLNCTGCEAVKISCINSGTVTLQTVSALGATNTAEVTVKKEDVGTIEFEKSSYKCMSGGADTIEGTVVLSAVNSSYPIVSSYKSSNTNVASIEKKDDKTFIITCKSDGNVTITATTSLGAIGTSTVEVVSKNSGSIAFDKSSYVCLKGEEFSTNVVTKGILDTGSAASLKTIENSKKAIATATYTTGKETTTNVKIKCNNTVGKTTLTAKSTTGVSGTATVEVKAKIGDIKFDKSSYTCVAGNKLTIKVTGTGESSSGVNGVLDTLKSSNEKYVTSKVVSTTDGVSEVEITCVSAGSVTLTATSKLKSTATAKVTVSKNSGSLSFKDSEFTCIKGEKLTTTLTASGSFDGKTNYISKISASSNGVSLTYPTDENQTSKTVTIECKTNGKVTITGTSTLGSKATLTVNVSASVGSIAYDQKSYSCNAGKSFNAKITATGTTSAGKKADVESYSSSNTNIATIEKVSSETGYVNVKVNCIKAGSVTLTAKSTLGASATKPTVTVSSNKGSISFKNTSFECLKDEEFTTVLTATGETDTTKNTVSAIKSSSAAVTAELSDNSSCTNNTCKNVKIKCNKIGTATLTGTSSFGSTSTATVSVKSTIGKINFDKTTYTCLAGNYFYAVITPTGTTAAGKTAEVTSSSIKSSNTTYVKIEEDTTQKVCDNCKSVKVSCLTKKDSITLSASSTLNATTPTTKVTVQENKGSIKFGSTSYSCYAGEKINTTVTASVTSNLGTLTSSVSDVTSSNKDIASISKSGNIYVIDCKKEGTVKLTAKSSLGATSTVEVSVN